MYNIEVEPQSLDKETMEMSAANFVRIVICIIIYFILFILFICFLLLSYLILL